MRRIFPSSIWFSRTATIFAVGFVTSGFVTFGAVSDARADEFSLVPLGNPAYERLALLWPAAPLARSPITRYEAALQTARAVLDLGRAPQAVSRSQWRAMKFLTLSFRAELQQIGVDTKNVLALCERGLEATTAPSGAFSARESNALQSNALQSSALESNAANGSLRFNSSPSNPPIAAPANGFLMAPAPLDAPAPQNRAVEIPLSQKLRTGAALTATQRSQNDPFGESNRLGAASQSISRSLAPQNEIASQKSLAFDVNPTLTVRAATSQRDLTGVSGDSPLLGATLFAGATEVKSAGGGVDLKLGALKLSTEIEQLRANTGAGAARIGGGTSFSLFQNRLAMQMSLSRLLPTDKAALPATAAQLGASLDVTRRLRLNLQYQGLFSPAPSTIASKVSGGVSLSF